MEVTKDCNACNDSTVGEPSPRSDNSVIKHDTVRSQMLNITKLTDNIPFYHSFKSISCFDKNDIENEKIAFIMCLVTVKENI